MKKIIILITLSLLTFEVFSQTNRWQQKVPGRNYTYEEIIFNRGIIQRQRKMEQKMNAPDPLKGQGIEFQGVVEITSSEGVPQYKAFIRGCGKVELPKKDDSEMQKLKNGARVRLRFIQAGQCEVSEWERF